MPRKSGQRIIPNRKSQEITPPPILRPIVIGIALVAAQQVGAIYRYLYPEAYSTMSLLLQNLLSIASIATLLISFFVGLIVWLSQGQTTSFLRKTIAAVCFANVFIILFPLIYILHIPEKIAELAKGILPKIDPSFIQMTSTATSFVILAIVSGVSGNLAYDFIKRFLPSTTNRR